MTNANRPAPRPGEQLKNGQYTIRRPLSKGGMGALYLATHTIAGLDRPVVIKEMLEYYDAQDPNGADKARARFKAEAATLASLSGAGIPQVFDYFSEGGRNYIVMQAIEGQNLEAGLTHETDDGQVVRGRPYPPEQVRAWGIKLSRTLEYLASKNVIHMDIKPANLILDPTGEVWLVDFGTAKATWGGGPVGKAGLKKSSVYGTLGYAPPEQAAGKPESRSDVFALAATLYHLLTDEDPRNQPYAYPQLNRLPKDLAAALRRALTQDVRQRPTAAEFGRSLAVSTTTGPTFRWQDGTIAYDPRDLASASLSRWEEARGYFSGGEWGRWFRDLHRHDVLALVNTARDGGGLNMDVALDRFLRSIDPALPPPRMELSRTQIQANSLPWGVREEYKLEVRNTGSGILQAQFRNLPAGVHVSPVEIVTLSRQAVTVTVDANELSPAARPYRLALDVDGGPGGRQQVIIQVTVPEPRLQIVASRLDMGSTYSGKKVSGYFMVTNPGGSKFRAEIFPDQDWLQVEPASFLCTPGRSQIVHLSVDTQGMAVGEHSSDIHVRATALGWERSEKVSARVGISLLWTFLVKGFPRLAWVFIFAFVGLLFSLIPGIFMNEILWDALRAGHSRIWWTVIGAAAGAIPGYFTGWLSGIRKKRMEEYAWREALIGALPGVGVGWLMGTLLNMAQASGSVQWSSSFFLGYSMLVCGITGALFGVVFVIRRGMNK